MNRATAVFFSLKLGSAMAALPHSSAAERDWRGQRLPVDRRGLRVPA